MYSVLLVDDEEEIREGMKQQIPWQQCGFELPETAENGLDALEKAERLKPNVIITDVKMPFMSGLELIEKANVFLPMTKFIVCSGFDDFEYAQQAISLSVSSYILKPFSANEFVKTLIELKQAMDKEWQEKKDVLTLKNQLQANESLIFDNFFISGMQGAMEKSQINQLATLIGLDTQMTYAVFSLYLDKSSYLFDKKNKTSSDKQLLSFAIKQIFDDWLSKMYEIHSFILHQNIVYVIQLKKTANLDTLLSHLNALCKECCQLTDRKILGGLSLFSHDLTKLDRAYRQAMTALEHSIMLDLENNFVTYIGDVGENLDDRWVSSGFDTKLISVIKSGDEKQIESAIQEMFDYIESQQLSLKTYQMYVIDIFSSVMKTANLFKVDNLEIFGESLPNITDIVTTHPKNIIHSWLVGVSKSVNEKIKQKNIKSSKNLVENSKKYVREHFTNPELSVELVSKELFFSPTYFSTIFKRETGQSFVSYLTDIRLEKAIDYLENSEEKNYVIADKIGYTDANYFSYVFKRKFGMSPKKYRQESVK